MLTGQKTVPEICKARTFDRARFWAVLVQRQMSAAVVVVGKVAFHDMANMLRIDFDDKRGTCARAILGPPISARAGREGEMRAFEGRTGGSTGCGEFAYVPYSLHP